MLNYKGLEIKIDYLASCKDGIVYSYYNEKVGQYFTLLGIKRAITKYLKKEGK